MVVPLTLMGGDGTSQEILAVIDTGFSGALTLPLDSIRSLGCVYYNSTQYTLADGTEIRLDQYNAVVLWEGVERNILVLEMDGTPLIGMKLLKGNNLNVDVVDGGRVSIQPL